MTKSPMHTGNYNNLFVIRAERLAQRTTAEKQQAVRAHLEDYIRRFRAKSHQIVKQTQSPIEELDRHDTAVACDGRKYDFSFRFFMNHNTWHHRWFIWIMPPLAMMIYQCNKDQSTHHPRCTIGDFLGANGAGKSTLIKALVGGLPLIDGICKVSETLQLLFLISIRWIV